MSAGLKLLVDSHHGQYIPKVFVETFDMSTWGVSASEAKTLLNPDSGFYWDTWYVVETNAKYVDENGNVWKLMEMEDLWAYCYELMSDDEYLEFFGEERE